MIKKQLESYEAPNVQLVDLRIESGILTTSGGTEQGDVISGGWDPLL